MSQDEKKLLPLAGIKVLDIATMLAAPFCASVFGEFGADVTKIEMPGRGDGFRNFGSMTDVGSFNWLNENRNKKSITLDLRKPEGAAVFKKLLTQCDVLVENFRPGTLERWGLGYEELKKIKPDLIMIRVTAYGQTGPNRDRPGFARLAHAFSGFAEATGESDGPPLMPGSQSLGDYISGLYASIGALLALTARNKYGVGQFVDISLYESLFRLMDEMAPVYAKTGRKRERMGMDVPNTAPHSHYRCQDGKWIAVACSSDKMFERLASVMKRPDLLAEEEYGTMPQRLKKRAELNAIVSAWAGSMPRAEVLKQGLEGGVALSEVFDIADIFADAHYQARQTLVEVEDPRVGSMVIPNVYPRLSETPGRFRSLGPDLGNDNEAVYRDQLGMPQAEIDRLKALKII
jgi:succinyl-CoA:(S)-malate CoA-transferase subunit A/succinyl-CoA:(S)-malate CoA-transferase subunit B